MSLYNSTTFSKLIVNGVSYNKAYMGSKTLFENNNPFTIEMVDAGRLLVQSSNNISATLYVTIGSLTSSINITGSTSFNIANDGLSNTGTGNHPNIPAGSKIKIKIVYNTGGTGSGISIYSQSARFKAYGDITTFNDDIFCRGLFKSQDYGSNLVDISGIVFPNYTTAYCYYEMFRYCSALTETPDLPATTLADRCYIRMFADCSNITELTMNATEYQDGNSGQCLGMLLNTASNTTGTLYLPEGHNYPTTNISYLPTNWSVELIEINYSAEYLTFKNVSDDDINIDFYIEWDDEEEDDYDNDPDDFYKAIYYSFDKETWTPRYSIHANSRHTNSEIQYGRIELPEGQTVYIKSNNPSYRIDTEESFYYCYFRFSDDVEISGNIMSLVADDNFQNATFDNTKAGNLGCMFRYDTHIVSAENLIIPANNSTMCYTAMFSGCTNLVKGPKITATSTPSQYAYNAMFSGCSSLTSIHIDSPYISGCYNNWLNNTSASGTIYYTDDSWQNAPTGASGIPSGWTATKVS